MKIRTLLLLLFLSSFIGYLEWGHGNHMLLIEAEIDIIKKFTIDPLAVLHPFTLIPFAGQVLILITIFQKPPRKKMVIIGMACIGILLILMFAIGLMTLNVKIIFSTVPFITISIFILRYYRTMKKNSN